MDEDVEAFIHARYEALLRYSYLLIGDRGAAEDLLQEVQLVVNQTGVEVRRRP